MTEAEHKSGLLDRARVYLSGPMYYGGEAHGDGDGGWRRRVADFLEAQGATVFNPWQKPPVRGGPYLPGGTLSTLVAGGNDQLAWGAALGLVVLYGVVAATVSLAVFRTRDIVS